MKPAPFEYHRPGSVDEVIELLADLEDVELMAGNQSLGIIMSNRLATPTNVIDLNGVDELAFVERDDASVEIGAMTRHRTVERSTLLADVLEMLPEAAGQIAGPSVRNRGTVGGSLAEADPAGNYPTAFTALDATVHLRSREGEREVPVREFALGHMFTDRREDELLTHVDVPLEAFPPDRTGMAFLEMKPAAQAFPTISAATAVRVDDPSGEAPVVEEARVAVANAADTPLYVPAAADAVEGEPLSDDTLEAAGAAAYEAADPSDEPHADAEFKREVAAEYTRRSLRTAYERAGTKS